MVMGAMPGMQSGNMMAGAAMPGQMTGMGPACYNMGQGGYNMAATSMYNNMAPQQPVAAKQPFQQVGRTSVYVHVLKSSVALICCTL